MINPPEIIEDSTLLDLILDNQLVHPLPRTHAILLTDGKDLNPDGAQLFFEECSEPQPL